MDISSGYESERRENKEGCERDYSEPGAILRHLMDRKPFIPSDLLSCVSGIPVTRFKQCLKLTNVPPILKCSTVDLEPQTKQIRGPRLVWLTEAREAIAKYCPRRLHKFDKVVEHYELDTTRYVFSAEAMRVIGKLPSYWNVFVAKYDPQGTHVIPIPSPAWGGKKQPPFTKRRVTRVMPVIIVPLSEITRLMNSIESQNGREQTSSRMTKKMRMLPSRPYEHEIPEELRARGCISMREATERSGYSLHYIGTLLRNGNIAGEKFSGRGLWAPNEEDLARYINEFGIDQASYSKETGLSIISGRCSLSEKDKKNNPLKKRRRGRYNGAARIDEKDTADWITLRDAAEISGLKTPLLRKLCSLGSFSCARKINRSWVLRRDEFMKVFGPFGLLVGNTLLKATPDKQKKCQLPTAKAGGLGDNISEPD